MAADVIGALKVVLGLDTASFDDGLNKSAKGLDSFWKQAAAVGAGIGLEKAVEKVTEAFVGLVKESINLADEMGKMSQKIGIPVEQLSSMSVAAKLADVEVGTFAKGVARLSTELTKAAAGGIDPAASALQYLHLSAKQLVQLSPDVAFGKIADAIAKMPDGMNKTAVASALFGQRLGKDLIPLLNSGAKGFEEMAQMSKALGLVISTDTAKQSEKFNDNMKLMNLAIQGVGLSVAAYFIPGMAKASEAMVKWVVDGQVVMKIADAIIRTFIFLGDNTLQLGVIFAVVFGPKIVEMILAFTVAILRMAVAWTAAAVAGALYMGFIGLVAGAIALAGAVILTLTGYMDLFLNKLQEIMNTGFIGWIKDKLVAALAWAGFNVSAFSKSIDTGKDSTKAFMEELKKLMGAQFNPNMASEAKKFSEEMDKIRLKTRELNGEFNALAPGFVEAAIKLKLLNEGATNWTGTIDSLKGKMAELNLELAKFAVAKLDQEFLTPWQQYQQELTKLGAIFSQVTDKPELLAQATLKATTKMNAAYADMALQAIGGFTQLFQQLGTTSKSMFRVWQAFAIAEATINTYKAANLALASPPGPPISYAYVAAAIAAGIANVIKISSTKFTGAAMGGRFKVPGGSMGVDTRLIPMALAPGELVDVTPAHRAGDPASGGVLSIPEINPQSFFTGDVVRSMVSSIDQWMRDGGTGIRMVPR